MVRYWFEPANARFFEYRSTGPGAIASPTRRVLSDGDARTYTVDRVLDGWTPAVRPQ
jgi:pectinesterase